VGRQEAVWLRSPAAGIDLYIMPVQATGSLGASFEDSGRFSRHPFSRLTL